MSTQLLPVNGKLQLSTVLLFPFYESITTNQNKQDMTGVGKYDGTVESSDLVLAYGDDDLGFVAGHQVHGPAHPLHQATLKQEPQLTT